MKTLFPLVLVAVALVAFDNHAWAAKGKNKKQEAPAVAQSNPAEELAPYINSIDQLLALRRGKMSPKQSTLITQASGRLVTLRAGFVADRAKAAEADRGKFDAAIATCDGLAQAVNERQETLGNLKSSKAVQSSGKMEEGGRKDNLQQGLDSKGYAKAVGTVVERDREREANAKAAARADQNEDAMNAMAINRWNKRSLELKTAITANYARIR
jgi:hypothetical protein